MLAGSLFTVIAFLATFDYSQAAGESEHVAPRSMPSPGGTCYYKCPSKSNNGNSFTSLNTYTDHYYGITYTTCSYAGGEYCQYYTNTGELAYGPCSSQLPISECTSTAQGNPNSNEYFKREVGARGLTAAEKRIKALQYKPIGKKAEKIAKLKRKSARRIH